MVRSVSGGYNIITEMDNGTLTLTSITMETSQGYYQIGGTLISISGSIALDVQGTAAELDGGFVKLGNANMLSTLDVTGNVNFHGAEYDAKLNPQANFQDRIRVIGTVDITASSKLKTSWLNQNQLLKPRDWDVLHATLINGQFTEDFSGTPGVTGHDPNQLPTDYALLA